VGRVQGRKPAISRDRGLVACDKGKLILRVRVISAKAFGGSFR
jgi:hypothetical protein